MLMVHCPLIGKNISNYKSKNLDHFNLLVDEALCFIQFLLISDTPLYTTNTKSTLSFTKQTQKNTDKSVWQNIGNAK